MRYFMLTAAVGLLSATLGATQSDKNLRMGLVGEYYTIGKEMDKMPDVSDIKPTLRRVDRQINFGVWSGALGDFGDTNLKTYFYVRWTGVLNVPADGCYKFYLASDDGSKLWIDGKCVVDNDGAHAMNEDSRSVDLKSGHHDFKLEFFQNKGIAACKVSWETKGVDKQVIPATSYFHKVDKDLDAE